MRRPPSLLASFVPCLFSFHFIAASDVVPLTNDNIRSAVRLWQDTDENNDRSIVEEMYGGPIEVWDVSGITSLDEAFADTDNFQADLSQWDVSQVTSMRATFYNTTQFAANIVTWDVSKVFDMRVLLAYSSDFLSDISQWDTTSLQLLRAAFVEYTSTTLETGTATNRDFSADTLPISNWKTPALTDMEGTFARTHHFHVNLTGWTTSKVTTMAFMLEYTVGFYGGDLVLLNTSNVQTMESMFGQAIDVRGAKDITLWDTSNVGNMDGIFFNTTVTLDDGDSAPADVHPFFLCWDLTGLLEGDALDEAFCYSNAGGFDCKCVPDYLRESINSGCNTTQKSCFNSIAGAHEATAVSLSSSAFSGMRSSGWGQLLLAVSTALLLHVNGV
jgi:surface protein